MYILGVISVYLLLFIIRTVKGPSAWDRLLGMSLICTKGTIVIVVFASYYDISYLLDFAIIHTLLGFICIIFIAFFILKRTKGGD